jgi:hypothetical protein
MKERLNHLQKNYIISSILGALIAGLLVYFILWYLFIPYKYTIPLSVFVSLLSFGLTKYYSSISNIGKESFDNRYGRADEGTEVNIKTGTKSHRNNTTLYSSLILIAVYSSSLIVTGISAPSLAQVYVNWNSIDVTRLVTLGAAIVLSFFIPGYTIVLLLFSGKQRINPGLKLLIGYILSMLITTLTVYLCSVSSDSNAYSTKSVIISVNIAILFAYIVYSKTYSLIFRIKSKSNAQIAGSIPSIGNIILHFVKEHNSEILVFGSILGILVVHTYGVYGGITIGDQWYHQNRAMLIMSGHFKQVVLADGDESYPPLQSALLAGVSSLSGIPLVNTYSSFAFLNVTAVFAFYYFCCAWFPPSKKKAALFAACLFLLASGIHWAYVLYSAQSGITAVNSAASSFAAYSQDRIKLSDTLYPSNFMISAHPDYSTGLIYVVLPAGFVLLTLARLDFRNKLISGALVSAVTLLGILVHDEFYFFIIVCSLLPLIFNMRKRSYLYLSFVASFVIVYAVDEMLPVKYFTSNAILGVPLIVLSALLVLFIWAVYAAQQKFGKRLSSSFSSWSMFLKKSNDTNYLNRKGINLVLKLIIVFVALYLFALSLIAWTEIPLNDIELQTDSYTTPWYVYSMRLGLTGLVGLLFVLSYLFHKFEKEVFVFGIIVVFALLAGPYYDEMRFSKYIMAGMVGFASLLIFKVLLFTNNRLPIFNGVIVGSILVVAGLSTMMLIGYSGLIIDTKDYVNALGRRNFPSVDEMNVLELLRSRIASNSSTYNVASFLPEYHEREGGIITKLHAFSGLPYVKTLQSPMTLNATGLGAFYHLVEKTNTKYIMIPKTNIKQDTVLPDPLEFALKNFQKIYEDDQYVVVETPTVHGPSDLLPVDIAVAIVDKNDKPFSPSAITKTSSGAKLLQFDSDMFDLEKQSENLFKIKNETIILYGNKKDGGKTLWSKNFSRDSDIETGINYIEAKFMIIGENKTGEDTAGIKWSVGDKIYHLYVSDNGLALTKRSPNYYDNDEILIAQNTEVNKKDWLWYLLRVESSNSSIKVYVDNLLAFKSPQKDTGTISKVAVNSNDNAVEFMPLRVAKIPSLDSNYDRQNKYPYYYSLSSLALSGSAYDIFSEDDFSMFSKKVIVLPFDPQGWRDTELAGYINFIRLGGGSLVVINSEDDFVGKFSQLLGLKSNTNYSSNEFSRITNDYNNEFNAATSKDRPISLNISGYAKGIDVPPDTKVTAWYTNTTNGLVAPFAIEKNFQKGKIVFVNARAYFDAIYDSPGTYFASLSNLPELLSVNLGKKVSPQITPNPTKRFVGDLSMEGEISINSSSLSVISKYTDSDNITAESISIFDNNGKLKDRLAANSTVRFNLYGPYQAAIKSKSSLSLPDFGSQYDYIGLSVPNGFNMSIDLKPYKNSSAEIISNIEHQPVKTTKLSNGSRLELVNVKSTIPLSDSVALLMKKPDIHLIGNATFEKANLFGWESNKYALLKIYGKVNASIDFVDIFDEHNKNATRTQFLTYLKSLSIDGKTAEDQEKIKLPGDIAYRAKERAMEVSLQNILMSSSNIFTVSILGAATVAFGYLLNRLRAN